MTSMLIVRIWRHPLPSSAAAAVAAAIFLWPALPLGGVDQWLFVYLGTTYLLVLYPLVAVLSGLYVGLVVYNKKIAPACPVEGARLGAAGSAMGVLFGVCPACIPVVAVFLPLGFTIFLGRMAPILSLAAIGLLLFVIYRLGGFRRPARIEAEAVPAPMARAGGNGSVGDT